MFHCSIGRYKSTNEYLLYSEVPVSVLRQMMNVINVVGHIVIKNVVKGSGVTDVPLYFFRSTVNVCVTQHNILSLGLESFEFRNIPSYRY